MLEGLFVGFVFVSCMEAGKALISFWDPSERFLGGLCGVIIALGLCMAVLGNG